MNTQEHEDLARRLIQLSKIKEQADKLSRDADRIRQTIDYLTRNGSYTGCDLVAMFIPDSNKGLAIAHDVVNANYARLAKVSREAFIAELRVILQETLNTYTKLLPTDTTHNTE